MCDGVFGLRLKQASEKQIDAIGVAIWAEARSPFYLAPFECEFYFANSNATEIVQAVVRFGEAGPVGEIVKVEIEEATPEKLILDRPKEDTGWAIAIQIDER